MGTYVTMLIGLAAVLAGACGIKATWPLVWNALQALLLIGLVIGGLLAICVSLGETRQSS